MPYCTNEDIKMHLLSTDLVNLTDDAGTGEVDDDVVAEAIGDADALIDSHLRGAYSVPLDPVPRIIRKISVTLAVCELYDRHKGVLVPEPVQKSRETMLALLQSLAKGEILLDSSAAPRSPLKVLTDADERDKLFGRDTLEAY